MNAILNFIKKLIASFDNTKDGFSGRKLSSFAAVCVCVYLSNKYCDRDNLGEILMIWLAFASLCLGLVTMQQVIDLKNSKSTYSKTETTKTSNEINQPPF